MEIKLLTDCIDCIPELAQLHFEQWSILSSQITLTTTKEKIKKHLNSFDLPLTFVALNHNEILGSASLRVEDHDTKKDISPWLESKKNNITNNLTLDITNVKRYY